MHSRTAGALQGALEDTLVMVMGDRDLDVLLNLLRYLKRDHPLPPIALVIPFFILFLCYKDCVSTSLSFYPPCYLKSASVP